MTAAPPERAITQPQSKAAPTVQSSHQDVIAIKVAPTSRASSKARSTKPRQDVDPTDFTSKSATLSLIRRTLIRDANQPNDPRSTPGPIEGILPPLTSSNEIDLQLYAIIAIVVKDFVNTWYSKITQDHNFVEEVVQIIAHCSRALEERIRHADIAELILDKVPVLLERHVLTYRTATSSTAKQSYGVDPRVIYHSLNPHPALAPVLEMDGSETSQNETVYRQILVRGALATLLPTEDLQNAPLRVLVTDIIADLIIGQAVAEKVCEGWFLHDAIAKGIIVTMQKLEPKASGEELQHKTKTRLEEFGLLDTKKKITSSRHRPRQSNLVTWFWRIMQWIYLITIAVRFIVQGLIHARHLPKRLRPPVLRSGSVKISPLAPIAREYDQSPQPVLAYSISNFLSTLMRLGERMPWASGTVTFWQHVLVASRIRMADTNSVLDRFFYHVLGTYVFTPQLVTSVLVGLRIGVFPSNSLGPPAPPPLLLEERLEIKRRAASAILKLIPIPVARKYFDSDDEESILQQIEEDILDCFGDKYMNKHLIYGLLEMILVTIIPELAESSVTELFSERGVSRSEDAIKVKDIGKVPVSVEE